MKSATKNRGTMKKIFFKKKMSENDESEGERWWSTCPWRKSTAMAVSPFWRGQKIRGDSIILLFNKVIDSIDLR